MTTADYTRAVEALTAALGAPTETTVAESVWHFGGADGRLVMVSHESRGVVLCVAGRVRDRWLDVPHLVTAPSEHLTARMALDAALALPPLPDRAALAAYLRDVVDAGGWRHDARQLIELLSRDPAPIQTITSAHEALTWRSKLGVALCSLDVAVAVARAVMTDTAGERA